MGKPIPFSQAAEQICFYLGFDVDDFLGYANEDRVGGYPEKWPMGSIWEVEGKVLYALVRLLRPKVALEFGTGSCCSTAHICRAMNKNGVGQLISVDKQRVLTALTADGHQSVKRRRYKRVKYVVEDALVFLQSWDSAVDFALEDTIHSREVTREILKSVLPHLSVGGVLVAHDTEHFLVGADVSAGFQDALGDFGSVLIEPSDCGLGYWRYGYRAG